tara:strand:- start:391 stop:1365 length:975 start_codon:yes stop_codon:yes gene_type:complete
MSMKLTLMSSIALNEIPYRLNNGIEGELWQVRTADVRSFHELISFPERAVALSIDAQLFFPPGIESPAAVIVVPGSLGVGSSHMRKAELLVSAGIAACVIDPFRQRGVTSTVSNQAQYSFAASAWDVIATLEQLTNLERVDPSRIGAQGHSRGGSAVLSAICLQRLLETSNTFSAVYAAYPWCGQQFLNPQVDPTRVRAIVGDQDEWCSPQQVQGYIQAIRLTGGDATCKIVDGAHHSFDRDTPLEMIAEASVAPSAPTIYVNDDGSMIHPISGETATEWSERELMLYSMRAGFGRRGAHIGGSGQLADIFHSDMMSYWQSTFS